MNELTQERSRIHASIAKSVLGGHQTARYMNELTQERSHIHASIAKKRLTIYQTARNMRKYMQEPALSNRSFTINA